MEKDAQALHWSIFFYLCVCILYIFSNDIRFVMNSLGLDPLANFYPIHGSKNVHCQNNIIEFVCIFRHKISLIL